MGFDSAGGIIQTVAGSGATAGQDPACIAAPNGYIALSQPGGLAVDPDGNVYISDTGNHRILKLATDGSLAQIAQDELIRGWRREIVRLDIDGPYPMALALEPLY